MGPVLGWTSTIGNEEADMPPFSPFQSWDSTPSGTPASSLPLSHPQHTYSLSARPPSHKNASLIPPPIIGTQIRRASDTPTDRRATRKRQHNPNWVPRPLNSFMVFRVEYSRKHAQEQRSADSKTSVAEKTLSKRASEAWSKMSQFDKKVYRDKAGQLKVEHSKLYPDYRYKPRRKRAVHPAQANTTRHQKVMSHMMKHVRAGEFTEESNSPPEDPVSLASFSPEPQEVPRRVKTPPRSVRRRRSYSLPLSGAPPPSLYPTLRTYHLEPETVTISRRAVSSTRASSIFMSSGRSSGTCSPYLVDDISSYWASTPTTPSTPDTAIFDSLSFDDGLMSYSGGLSPQNTGSSMMSDMLVRDGLSSIPELTTAPNVPLVQRRQRSNTTSAIPPSPLNLVSSSLANWNGIAAASTSSLPTWGFMHSSPGLEHQTLQADSFTSQAPSSILPNAGNGTLSPGNELGAQHTPRMAEFHTDIHNHYTMQGALVQSTGMVTESFPEYPSTNGGYGVDADLEAYAAGLESLNIMPEAYDILSPPDELNFSDLFHVSP